MGKIIDSPFVGYAFLVGGVGLLVTGAVDAATALVGLLPWPVSAGVGVVWLAVGGAWLRSLQYRTALRERIDREA